MIKISSVNLFLGACVLIWVVFTPFFPATLYGDDLVWFWSAINNDCELVRPCSDQKYRPLSDAVQFLAFHAFERKIDLYIVLNTAALAFTAVVFLRCCQLIFPRVTVSFLLALGLAFCISRFSWFQVSQVIGSVEWVGSGLSIISIALFLTALRFGYEGRDALRARFITLAVMSAIISPFAHERFAFLGQAFALAILILPSLGELNRLLRISLVVVSALSPLWNFLFKKLLGVGYLVGTGGAALDFNFNTFKTVFSEAFFSTIGINWGPAYLVGLPFGDAGLFTKLISVFAATSVFLLLIFYFFHFFIESRRRLTAGAVDSATKSGFAQDLNYLPLFFLAIFLLGLLAASVTFRMEQRWLFVPYLGLLLFFVSIAALGSYKGLALKWLPAVKCIPLFFVLINLLTLEGYKNIYAYRAATFASQVLRYEMNAYIAKPSALYFSASEEYCRWALGDGLLFKVYLNVDIPVHCSELDADTDATAIRHYSFGGDLAVRNTTSAARRSIKRRSEYVVYDFLERFSNGNIDGPSGSVATPTGDGVILLDQNFPSGQERRLVILPGYAARFFIPTKVEGDKLIFAPSLVYPSHSAGLTVRVIAGGIEVLRERVVVELLADDKFSVGDRVIDLEAVGAGPLEVRFEVDANGGSPNAVWVALSEPRIVGGAE